MTGLDWFLSDPALILPKGPPPAGHDRAQLRFRPDSVFARDFGVPPEAACVIVDRYEQNGRPSCSVAITGVPGMGYATGVPVAELRPAGPEPNAVIRVREHGHDHPR